MLASQCAGWGVDLAVTTLVVKHGTVDAGSVGGQAVYRQVRSPAPWQLPLGRAVETCIFSRASSPSPIGDDNFADIIVQLWNDIPAAQWSAKRS